MSFDEMVDKQIREDIADLKRDSSNWQIRIEALRASTEITKAKIAAGDGFLWNGKNVTAQDYMLSICPLIERYLEGGK